VCDQFAVGNALSDIQIGGGAGGGGGHPGRRRTAGRRVGREVEDESGGGRMGAIPSAQPVVH
jgi:hypothetical protein